MLRVVTGRFHPDLQDQLGRDVLRAKRDDPLASLAVIVPSSALATHLRRHLASALQRPLLNLSVLTFHQLALRLSEEQGLDDGHAVPQRRIEILPDVVFEHLTGHLGRRRLGADQQAQAAPVGPGGWSVLWRTLRDLRDAQVDPAVALRGVEEGVFPPEDADRLRALFQVQAALEETCRTLAIGVADDLTAAMVSWVPDSPFLRGVTHLWYYGFYDLTQVQLSLFEAVAARAPVTLYFPLGEGAAFAFARKFFDRHLCPLIPASQAVGLAEGAGPVTRPPGPGRRVEVFSTVGPEEELSAAAKHILSLVESEGCGFDRIGVVARSLEPYQPFLRRVFDAHAIPFTCSGLRPILAEPSVKTLLQLASLPVNQFYREPVLDVVTSPFRPHDPRADRDALRPDLWRLAARSLGIIRGMPDWRKLAEVAALDLAGDDTDSPGWSAGLRVPAEVLQGLWEAVSALEGDLRTLPAQGGYDEVTGAFVAIAVRHLDVPGLSPGWEPDAEDEPHRRVVGNALRQALAGVAHLARLGEPCCYEEWLAALQRAIEDTLIPVAPDDRAGVQVLDAMTARGLSFGALLILGLNESSFPRAIQEDPFLHDRHRRVLAETLGYKIDEKLTGHDEEALLLRLLSDAAEKRLALFHQRADAQGRILSPSPYVTEVLNTGVPEARIPRRLNDRGMAALGAPELAAPDELAVRVILAGDHPAPLLAASGREPELFEHGLTALQQLEGPASRVGARDGVIGPVEAHWERIATRGVSPTSLERYVTCPFRYFSSHVLRLEDLRPEVPEELPARVYGTLVHAVLRDSHAALLARGWPDRALPATAMTEVVRTTAQSVCAAYERREGTGYWLLWQMTLERVSALVAAVLEDDGEELRGSGYRPVGFETEVSGRLGDVVGAPFANIPIRGRADRIDIRRQPIALRIVDYKYTGARALVARERDLAAQAVQGRRLQPPLYTLTDSWSGVDPGGAPAPERVDFVYVAPRSEPAVQRAAFAAAAWRSTPGPALRATLRRVLTGIQEGRFFIVPDGYCEGCEFAVVCRRTHGPTWQRAHAAGEARALRRMRRQQVTDAPDDRPA